MSSAPRLDPSVVLAAYAEPIVVGRRVIVFGNALSGLAERLLERGARIVQVYDTDPGRVAQASTQNVSRNVAFGGFGDGGLGVRDGAFDVGVVENLSAHDNPDMLLSELRRALGPRGVALVASPNPDVQRRLLAGEGLSPEAPDYYALYDLVAVRFPHVRMLGQAPFVGYAIVDFSPDGEPEPSIDAGLLGDAVEEADYFVALAGMVEVSLDEFALIQLPWRSVVDASAAESPAPALEQELAQARAELAQRHSELGLQSAELERRCAELEQRNAELAQRSEELERRNGELAQRNAELAQRSEELERRNGELDRLRAELAKREAWIAELEARANTADERADTTQAQLEQARADATRESELRLELAARLELAQTQLRSLSEQPDVSLDDEQARLEAQLLERGQEVRRLQKELAEAERTGRELVRELELFRAQPASAPAPEPEPAPPPSESLAELQQKLDALARLNAEREADLAATRWALQAVEARAELVAAAESRTQELERELASLRSELERVDQTRGAS